jgi:hypothetical protein
MPMTRARPRPPRCRSFTRATPGNWARFLSEEAGWTAADLDLLDGDEGFTAEVEAEMRALQAPGGAR